MGNDTDQGQLTPLLKQFNFWCECSIGKLIWKY